MKRNFSIILDAKTLKTWEAASDEVRLSTLIHYMQKYNVDKTYDNYILLTLAANGFLKIEYDRQVVDDCVLRHMKRENIWLRKEGDRVAKDKLGNSISIVHTVPDNHPLRPLAECAKSHYVNNPTHSFDLYASKFEADFELSYLMLLIGDKNLRENYRKIFLDIYQPKSNGALWEIPKKDWDELNLPPEIVYPAPATIKSNYGEWESFVVNFLDIKQGSVLDLYAGVGTLAMQLNLENVVYMANMSQLTEHDLMNMLFYTDGEFSEFLSKKQVQLYNDGLKYLEMRGLRGESFDLIIANCYNNREQDKRKNSYESFSLLNAIDLILSPKGKALVTFHYGDFRICWSYTHLIDSIILLGHDRGIVLLDKNKENTKKIKVYDRTDREDFTAEQLLQSIREQENLHILTLEDINDMGGYFDINVFKRNQYKIDVPAGDKLIKLSEVLTLQNGYRLRGSVKDVRFLRSDIKDYTPLSPYVTAENGEYISESDVEDRGYRLLDQKRLVIIALKNHFRTFIFDPRDGEAGFAFSSSFIVDEGKVNIDYLVYQMNEEYFLKQLFPYDGFSNYHPKAKDILSCQILVPDVESSVERQKQIIEDLRQKEIAAFARRYGYDLGEFVQYKDSDLPNGTKLKNGKYTIQKIISRGGFGKVYEAQNEETQEVVAIKEFFHYKCQVRDPQTNEVKTTFDANIDQVNIAKEKFRREKAKIQECVHDNIVKVYEEFEENNTCYYAMEYIDGKNLVNKKCIGEREALAIIRQVAEALKAMHAKGYNHSDVKPQNILLDSNGVVTLIDFGVAHCYGNDDEEGMSASPYTEFVQIKSEGYTPMQAYKKDGFHAGRDIYSLGATLYYMLTGNKPATIDKQVKPDKISPKSWKGICKAMEEDPRIWLRSMDEFLALLPDDDEAEINDIDVPEPIKKLRITPRPVVKLKKDEVFVFGSNIKGLHTGSAAKQALKWGAQMGVAAGPMGQSYGIPTVGVHGLAAIEGYVNQFVEYVKANDHVTFYVTAIGCGSAGFTPEQIAPLFKDCAELSNVYLPESFWQVLKKQ